MLFANVPVSLDTCLEQGLSHFGILFTPGMLRDLEYYVSELIRWGRRINLVGVKEWEPLVTGLLYDAFFLQPHITGGTDIVDVGSGAGILGLPLKITSPHLRVIPVDKSLRKIQFQRHIKRDLRMEGYTPVHGRLETIEPLGADVLVVKAFGSIESILSLAGRHLVEGGEAYILKGASEEPVKVEGYILSRSIAYALPVSNRHHRLFVYEKSNSTHPCN